MFHHKAYGRAGLSATETFEYSLGRRYRKRRSLLIVERTARDIVCTSFLQSNEVPDHINDLRRVKNPVNGILRNHILLLVNLFVFYILYRDRVLSLLGRLLLRHTAYLVFINGLLHLPRRQEF